MSNVVKTSSLRANAHPIDPDVKIPAAVQRAAQAAAALQAAAYPENQPSPAPTPDNKDTITIAPPPAPPVTPQGNPPAPVTPAPAPTPAPTPAPEESWEHKFKSAEGRRIKAENLLAQTTDRLSSLEQLVQDLQSRPAAPPAPATPAPTPTRLVTEQEETEFGPEMLDVMGRRAKEIVSPELAELRATVSSLEAKLNGTTKTLTRTARDGMLATLDEKMPDWRSINNLAQFKAWLALPDPYFGVIRHSALLSAFEQNDTPRVLNFFKGFVSELAVTDPDIGLPAPATPAAPQPDKPGLEALAAPGRARTPAQTNAPVEKQIITTADINAFYAAKARGAYNGREAEFAALEQELFKAQREGRVRAV